MNTDKLCNPVYDLLTAEEKKSILERLASEYGFELRYFKEFQAFGKTTFTAVFKSKDNIDFVFVPGAKVKTGLNLKDKSLKDILNEENLEDIAYSFIDYSELEDCSEEIIKIKIKAKFENKEFTDFVRERIIENIFEEAEYMIHPFFAEMEYSEIRESDEIHEEMTFEELLDQISQEGYSLPTKHEWEYMVSKGCDTIFPWGNNIDFTMNLKHLYLEESEQKYTLEEPNFFGLRIADDPYNREIVFDEGKFSYKGGDGGCSLCGGAGVFLGYLPVSAYYKNKDEVREYINSRYDFYRRIKRIHKSE